MEGGNTDRTQLHCPNCADTHDYNTTVLAAGGGAAVLGLVFVALGSISSVLILLGLIALASGGYLLYNEYQLKKEIEAGKLSS